MCKSFNLHFKNCQVWTWYLALLCISTTHKLHTEHRIGINMASMFVKSVLQKMEFFISFYGLGPGLPTPITYLYMWVNILYHNFRSLMPLFWMVAIFVLNFDSICSLNVRLDGNVHMIVMTCDFPTWNSRTIEVTVSHICKRQFCKNACFIMYFWLCSISLVNDTLHI